jgi:nitroreductase/NAD-dependent dihydropyrimidine dehydrogenase PreA subunit
MLKIDTAKCTRCGACVEECPAHVMAFDGNRTLQVLYPAVCVQCGHCVAICPAGAILHSELPADQFLPLSGVKISSKDMEELLISRRSTRAFTSQPIPKDLLQQLIKVGTHAGTGSNMQSEGFLIIQDNRKIAELEQLVTDALWDKGLKFVGNPLGQQLVKWKVGQETLDQLKTYYAMFKTARDNRQIAGTIFRNAPAVILAYGLKRNPLTMVNCALALRNMEVQALTLGLGTCWIGFMVVAASMDKKIARYLELPEPVNVYGAISIGYPKRQYRVTIPRKERTVRWL